MKLISMICTLLASMPLWLNRALGSGLGYMLYLIPKSRKITEQNISLCFPELNTKKRKQMLKKVMLESGKYTLENCWIWNHTFTHNAKYVVNIEGEHLLEGDTPKILLTPHFGGFELTGRVLSLQRKVHFLYRSAKKPEVDALILKYRNTENLHMHRADAAGVKGLVQALEKGEVIGILPDQNPSGSFAVSSFFGVPTHTTTLLCKLALKYEAKVLLTYALRVSGGYQLVLKEVDIRANELHESVQKMQNVIMELVTQYPEQYMWNYKKFKATFDYNADAFKEGV